MRQENKGKEVFHSRVYTNRPAYADFDAPSKFQAIQSIIAKRLREHQNAICSYSGGSDSDIMLDLIERTRVAFGLPEIKYCFFNTGLEMKATKDHVKEVEEKYGVEITEQKSYLRQWRQFRKKDFRFQSEKNTTMQKIKLQREQNCVNGIQKRNNHHTKPGPIERVI